MNYCVLNAFAIQLNCVILTVLQSLPWAKIMLGSPLTCERSAEIIRDQSWGLMYANKNKITIHFI